MVAQAKTFILKLNISDSYDNVHSNLPTTYQWQVGQICHINSMWFVPIMAVKCVKFKNQSDDQFDLIRKGDVYPVIIEMDEEIPNSKRFLLINRNGHKQYWPSSDFEIIESLFHINDNPKLPELP